MKRIIAISILAVFLAGCGMLRSTSVNSDTRIELERVQEIARGTITNENIRIVMPHAFELPVNVPNPPRASRKPTGDIKDDQTRMTAPAGTIIEINRTIQDTVTERTTDKADVVEKVHEDRKVEVKSGGFSWMLTALFAGIAGVAILIILIFIRFR